MKPGARAQSAIEILTQMDESARPAEQVLRDWGKANRFAGSKDRAAIGEYVFQILRHKSFYCHRMGSPKPRDLMIAHLSSQPDQSWPHWFDGSKYAPQPLTSKEIGRVENPPSGEPILAVKASVPEWLLPDLVATFGEELEPELLAFLQRAPLDLRVNGLIGPRKPVRAHLKRQDFATMATPHASLGLRVNKEHANANKIQRSGSFLAGEFEIQDEGSQLTVEHCNIVRGQTIVDLCAGGGGKTLALAAQLRGEGRVIACDIDKARLDNVKPRLKRSGAGNVELRHLGACEENGPDPDLADLSDKADLVFVDAPCSGSGAWRRHPDAKWRLTPNKLAHYCQAQASVLRRGAALVKPGGRLVYVTCSILACENASPIEEFLRQNEQFVSSEQPFSFPVRRLGPGAQLSPHRTGTDGFFISEMHRKGADPKR